MKRIAPQIAGVFLAIILAGCATVGHKFPADQVPGIEIGKTTSEEVRAMFGDPWRTGIEDGLPTWTYGRYKYRLIGDDSTTDLVVRFDANNVVRSYTFNTTEQEP
ncbi:MAG: outer membrane protein assembly factor BamE [Candidatus Eisenbacteria bacterium]